MEHFVTEYTPGDRLEVRYGRDNKWLPCTLNSLGDDEQCIVTITDTEKDVIVSSQRLRRPRHLGLPWRQVQELMDERGYYICPNACGQRINCTKSVYYKYHYGDRCANVALPAPAARGVCRTFDGGETRDQVALLHTGNVHQQMQEQFVAYFDDEHYGDMNMDMDMGDVSFGGTLGSPVHEDRGSSEARGGAALYQKWLERDGPKGSVQWFMHRLRQPIYEGSSMKVYDFVQWAVDRKLSSNMSRSEFEEWLRMVAATAPSNAIIPASWHIMKSIIKLPDLEDYVSHACVCHQYRYPRISKDHFEAHRHDKCPRCNEPRFLVDAGGRLQPRHWVWYLGLDNAIQQLFNDPEFTSKRGKSRTLGRWAWYICPIGGTHVPLPHRHRSKFHII